MASNTSENNGDFLQEFFKNNGMFGPMEDSAVQKKQQDDPQTKEKTNTTNSSQQISQRDINLKELFENIEKEKISHQKTVSQHIEKNKDHHEPIVSLIKLQSQSRALYEDFLKILPIIEAQFHLDELQARKERQTRGDQEYIPEIWETTPNAIFFDDEQKKNKKNINAFANEQEEILPYEDQLHTSLEDEQETEEEQALKIAILAAEEEKIKAEQRAIILQEQQEREEELQKQLLKAEQEKHAAEQEAYNIEQQRLEQQKKAEEERARQAEIERKRIEQERITAQEYEHARIALQIQQEEDEALRKEQEEAERLRLEDQKRIEQKNAEEKIQWEKQQADLRAQEEAIALEQEKAQQITLAKQQEEQRKQQEQQHKQERLRALEHQKIIAAQKAEAAEQEQLKQKELAALREREAELKKIRNQKRQAKVAAMKNHITRFGHRYIFTATQKMQKGLIDTGKGTKSVFAAANKKIISTVDSFDITAFLPKFPSQKGKLFRGKKHYAAQKVTALQRAKQKAIKKLEQKKSSGVTEMLKVGSIVATLFFVSMVGLNYSAFLERYERHWNASAFEERQDSISDLIKGSLVLDEKTTEYIPLLPVAGSMSPKKKEGFDTQLYLDVTPPDTRIIIPKIAKNIPIIDVGDESRKQEDWEQLEKDIQDALRDGVVHYPGTANPGQFGNTFITGHSSYYPWDEGKYKDVFAALHDLGEGDVYYIFHKGKKYKYKITTRKVVKPSDVSVLEQDTSKKTSTLMTCTPIGTTARRLILQAEQVEVE